LIGRSLYVLPLEWWYAFFPRDDIYFVCTEELSDFSGESMTDVGMFLGLPRYNFSETVRQGPYNVGGHRGYDEKMPWGSVDVSKKGHLPDDLKRELLDFIRPYNERLFELIGKRCDW